MWMGFLAGPVNTPWYKIFIVVTRRVFTLFNIITVASSKSKNKTPSSNIFLFVVIGMNWEGKGVQLLKVALLFKENTLLSPPEHGEESDHSLNWVSQLSLWSNWEVQIIYCDFQLINKWGCILNDYQRVKGKVHGEGLINFHATAFSSSSKLCCQRICAIYAN